MNSKARVTLRGGQVINCVSSGGREGAYVNDIYGRTVKFSKVGVFRSIRTFIEKNLAFKEYN